MACTLESAHGMTIYLGCRQMFWLMATCLRRYMCLGVGNPTYKPTYSLSGNQFTTIGFRLSWVTIAVKDRVTVRIRVYSENYPMWNLRH